MRLVSYNVRYFGHGLKGLASTAKSKVQIAKALASLDPLADVVALQEVETRSIRAGVAHRGGLSQETQLDAFMRHLTAEFARDGREQPYRATYFAAHSYQLGGVKFYTTGLAMLVNTHTLQAIKDNAHEPFPITFHASARLRKVKQTRIAAHVRLEDRSGHIFHVFNTHLSLPTPWAKDFWKQDVRMGFGENQVAEAKSVLEYAQVTAGAEPYLICGDFNAAPTSPVYRYLTEQEKLVGAQAFLKQIDPSTPDSFSTAGFMRWRMHLDHVFGRGLEFVNLDDTHAFGEKQSKFFGLSDHVPLITWFDL